MDEHPIFIAFREFKAACASRDPAHLLPNGIVVLSEGESLSEIASGVAIKTGNGWVTALQSCQYEMDRIMKYSMGVKMPVNARQMIQEEGIKFVGEHIGMDWRRGGSVVYMLWQIVVSYQLVNDPKLRMADLLYHAIVGGLSPVGWLGDSVDGELVVRRRFV